MLLVHCVRRAASRADCTAGSSSEIKMPMIVITTKSSTSVNPRRQGARRGTTFGDAGHERDSWKIYRRM